MPVKTLYVETITKVNGHITRTDNSTQEEYSCDICGTGVRPLRHDNYSKCPLCGRIICYECGGAKIPSNRTEGHYDEDTDIFIYGCKECGKKYTNEIKEIKNLIAKRKEIEEDIMNHISTMYKNADPYANDTSYQTKFKTFENQKANVDKGKYKNHHAVIKVYTKLLEEVPPESDLAARIKREISAHQHDAMLDDMERHR